MDDQGSTVTKRSYSSLSATGLRCEDTDYEEPPVKKKLRTKLVDLFNRASICLLKSQEERMKIYLRIKPFTGIEDSSQKCLVVVPEENTVIATAPSSSHAHKSLKRGLGKSSHKFTFSKIFNEDTSQAQFFNETMLEMTKDFIAGQNSLVFTYGVTSSGKTYTLQGKPQDAGVLPRCLDVIFNSINGKQIPALTLKPKMFTDVVRLSPEEVAVEKKIKDKTLRLGVSDDTAVKILLGDEMESALSDTALSATSDSLSECCEELLKDVENRPRELLKVDVDDQGKILFGVWVSFAEIYNEKIFDLLEPMPSKKNARRQCLKICDDKNGNPYIRGLEEINVETADEAYRLLTIGQRNLQTACTRLNHCSSRSHCIFNIKIIRITDKDNPHIARVNMLSLCDLAGSERYSKTQATGERLKEAGNINSSLMTLGRCIETLRHNQMHRDKLRLVPFRESKLTRLLQNFFNGSGRASMIVNVSQCAQMFDDTLHVFHFSAIAKQVKYIEQPIVETTKLFKDKKSAAVERESIPWESPEKGLRDTHIDLTTENVDDDDEEDSEDNQETFSKIKEMTDYIRVLETRNEKLVELLEEEMNSARDLESRTRREVTQALMKQVVSIEEGYSELLKKNREEGMELADERVRGIMEIYEEKLERVQKKVDEDDEWVSSLLYHQEQLKVQERDEKIKHQQEEIAKLKSKNSIADNSVDLGNSVLIETLTLKLQDSLDNCKIKDEKINDLEALLCEAGEDYNKHVAEISKLQETITELKDCLEHKISNMKELEKQMSLMEQNCAELKKTIEHKEKEMHSMETDLKSKIKMKDETITSMEEEIKEMQDEIERLQDQMSLIDEQSKYKNDLESSAFSEKLKRSEKFVKNNDSELIDSSIVIESPKKESNSTNDSEQRIGVLLKTCKVQEEEIITLKELNSKQSENIKTLALEKERLASEIKEIQDEMQRVTEEVNSSSIKNKCLSESLELLEKEKTSLLEELQSVKNTCEDLRKKQEVLKVQGETKKEQASLVNKTLENSITDMVKQLEGKHTPVNEINTPVSSGSSSKAVKQELSQEGPSELLVKLKNAEIANAALRNKLKKEEEDFFQREQALIHGYTAEIETLKYELAKLKTKVDVPKTRVLRGKRKIAGMDVSVSSINSESFCDSSESGIDIVSKDGDNFAAERKAASILSNELTDLNLQLLSLTAAYRKLQNEKKNETANVFIQDVLLGHSKSRPSTLGIFRSEENITDSLLQFEMEEYLIKMDELRLKISQQELEIKECQKAFDNEKMLSKEKTCQLEERQKRMEESNSKHETEKTSLNLELRECKDSMARYKEDIESLNVQLKLCQDLITEKESTEKLLEDQRKICSELKDQLVDEASSKELEIEQKQMILQLQDDLNKSLSLNTELKEKFEKLRENENTTKELMDSLVVENTQLKEDAEKLRIELQELKSKLEKIGAENKEVLDAQELLNETVERLKRDNTSKASIEKEVSELKALLVIKEEGIKSLENLASSLQAQQQECLSEQSSQSQLITSLQKQLEDTRTELLSKTREHETLSSKYQEETAEVAQKLLSIEKEKKMAERKAMEAKEKEEEWKVKCHGLERMQQLEQKLHEQLRAAANTLKKQREETVSLKEELEMKKEELEKLQQEHVKVKQSLKTSDDHNLQVEELVKKFDLEKESMKEAYQEQLNNLKKGLSEAEDIMMRHDEIISKQDDEILTLKAEIDSHGAEKDKLENLILSKDLEIGHLNKQLTKLEDSVKHSTLEQKERISQEQLQKANWEKGALKEKFQNLEKEKITLEGKLETLEKQLKCEKDSMEEADRKLKFTEKQKCDLEKKLTEVSTEQDLLREKLETLMKEKLTALEKITNLELEIMQWKNVANKDISQSNKQQNAIDGLEETNVQLKQEVVKLQQDLSRKEDQLKEGNKTLQIQIKEVQKLQRLNERNREEMELWRKEKDTCVRELEIHINKKLTEIKSLNEEIEKLKTDNSQLVKQVESITNVKDSVIADLRKSNNTLSIELAKLQGMSPPPTMMSPCNFLPKREFIEDIDTTGHIEIDATPPIAAKKNKRQGSLKLLQNNIMSSSVDPESSTAHLRKSLKTIEEHVENEMSPYTPKRTVSPTKHSLHSATGKVVELASELISNLTPLTRSARKKDKENKKSKKMVTESTSFEAELTPSVKEEGENLNPFGTRRSSRLRCKTKHSVV